MSVDDATITLQQWLSPGFPIGSFAFSHGLEGAVDMGLVHEEDTLRTWLADVLHHGSGRCDAVWLREGYAAGDNETLCRLDDEARAFAISHSRLQESARQGAAFARTLREVWQMDIPDLLLPLAVGAGACRRGYDLELLVPLYLHAFVSNLVAAAQRLLPMGQLGGQRVLVALQSDCRAVAKATEEAGRDALYSNTFLSDIASMQQESLRTRIFQS